MTDTDRPEPSTDALLRRAYRLHQQGDIHSAIAIYQAILAEQSQHAIASHLCGLAEHQRGNHAQAIALLSTAVQLAPDRAPYHNHLGAALAAVKRREEALACFEQAARLDPSYLEAFANCSAMHELAGNDEGALAALAQARRLAPGNFDLLRRVVTLYARLDRSDEATQLLQQAIEQSPNNAALHNELGIHYLGLNKADQAGAALQAALALEPTLSDAWYNLAQALGQQDLLTEAEQALQEAIQQQPDQVMWKLRHKLLCPPVFNTAQAIADFHAAFERRIDDGEFDLSRISLHDLLSSGFHPPYTMNFHGLPTRGYKEKLAALVRPLIPKLTPNLHNARPRIGFVITRGHHNLFLRCSGGIADRLNRDEFEVLILASAECLPELRRRLKNPTTSFVTLDRKLADAMQTLADARCDVLYHWETGSDDTNYLLSFAQAAPVQCTSWGTQVTSGVREVDYYLSSSWVEEQSAQEYYTEQLWRLSSLPTFQYRMPPPPPADKTYFGWSPEDRIYLCPQTLYKIHPDQDVLFQRILETDPRATIVLKQLRYPTAAKSLKQRLEQQLGKLAERVVFLPWLSQADYYRLVAVADVVLDAVHYTAGSSAYDMFSYQQPIVTLPGKLNVGRYTQACYRRMGFTDLIARDAEDYVRLAVQVANDSDYRQWVRASLKERADVLFEDRDAVTAHEDFFRTATLELPAFEQAN